MTYHGAIESPACGDALCADSRPRMAVRRRSTTRSQERGYVLLALLLTFSLIVIAAGIAATSIAFEIRRDREEEMMHRGAQYTRAIQRFTKKMGRYPLRLEDLENTDGLRFLRKRYKDPMTGKDFKLLHMTDLQKVGVGGMGAAVGISANAAGATGANPFGSSAASGDAATNAAVDPSAVQSITNQQPASPAQGFAGGGQSGFGGSQNTFASGQTAFGGDQNSPGTPNSRSPATGLNAANPASSAQPLGGGVIVGVASASKDKTIREFNHKNHYSDWLFFYDPAYDRGFEVKGPTQLTMPTPNLNPARPVAANPTQQ